MIDQIDQRIAQSWSIIDQKSTNRPKAINTWSIIDQESPKNRPIDQKSNIMRLVADQEKISRSDIQEAFGVSKSTAVNLLGTLVEKGLLKREGAGPAVRYTRA